MRVREIRRDRQKLATIGPLSSEEAEWFIRACQCPYCRDGESYKMLPLHIYQKHGISAYEFRKMLGLNRGHKLSSLDTSSLMSEINKKLPKRAWMEYDRSKSCLHRYEDGGKREEAIMSQKAISNSPIIKEAFKRMMADIPQEVRIAAAKKVPKEKQSERGRKGAIALRRKYGKRFMHDLMMNARRYITPESYVKGRIRAKKTMRKYLDDPVWRQKFREQMLAVHQARAKIPRSEWAHITGLYQQGVSQGKIAAQYGVSHALIHLIIKSHILGLSQLFQSRDKGSAG